MKLHVQRAISKIKAFLSEVHASPREEVTVPTDAHRKRMQKRTVVLRLMD